MKSRAFLLVACASSLAAACSLLVDTTDLSGGPTADAGTAGDAPIETGTTVVDAASDAGPDVSADASLDSALDAAPKPCGLGDLLEAPGLLDPNDNGAFDDRGARVTADGQWLLFSRRSATIPSDKRRIVISRRDALTSTWGPVRALDELNAVDANNSEPNFVPAPGGVGGRIFFTSDRLLNGTYQNTDFYYADVKDNDFTQIDAPVRLGTMVNGTVLSTGGLEGWSYILPTGPGAGRWFFARYVAVNHTDMFFTDFNNLVFTPPLPLVDLNLPDQSQEYKPAFGNGVLYFTSNRTPLADGGLERFPADAGAGFPDGGYVERLGGQIWAAKVKSGPGTPKFDPPVLVAELSRPERETNITSVSTDGCSIIFSANWDAIAADGRHRLYTVNRKRPQ